MDEVLVERIEGEVTMAAMELLELAQAKIDAVVTDGLEIDTETLATLYASANGLSAVASELTRAAELVREAARMMRPETVVGNG